MSLRSWLLAVVVTVGLLSVPQRALADEAKKEALVRELLELTGAGKLGEQVSAQMIDSMRGMPGLDPRFVDKFAQLARGDEMTEIIVPIYMKHFDEPTLKAVVAFYKTPAGQKLIVAMPVVMQESMTAGQEWGKRIAMKVQAEIAAEDAASGP